MMDRLLRIGQFYLFLVRSENRITRLQAPASTRYAADTTAIIS